MLSAQLLDQFHCNLAQKCISTLHTSSAVEISGI